MTDDSHELVPVHSHVAESAPATSIAAETTDDGENLDWDYTDLLAKVDEAKAQRIAGGRQTYTAPARAGYGPVDLSDPMFTEHGFAVPEGAHDAAVVASALQAFGLGADSESRALGEAMLRGAFLHEADHRPRDAADRDATRAELQELWRGEEYAATVAAVKSYIDRLPPAVSRALHHCRAPDGRALLNTAPFVVALKFAAERAVKLPARTGDVDADLRSLEEAQRADPDAFQRDPTATFLQKFLLAQRSARKRA